MTWVLAIGITTWIALAYVLSYDSRDREDRVVSAIAGVVGGFIVMAFAACIMLLIITFFYTPDTARYVYTSQLVSVAADKDKNGQLDYVIMTSDGEKQILSDENVTILPISSYREKTKDDAINQVVSESKMIHDEELGQAQDNELKLETYESWNSIMNMPINQYILYLPEGTVIEPYVSD